MSGISASPLVIGLPIADRQRSYTFYRDGLGLEPVGELADDGVPEPLQFVINHGVRVMFILTGGFGWVIGDRAVAESGTSECVLTLPVVKPADVDQMIAQAHKAGATVITTAGQQPWGYAGVFADPDGHVWMVSAQP